MKKILIDTDIGDDIDDALAIAYALGSPELDVVGITTTFRNVDVRTQLVLQQLQRYGRMDIPVATGIGKPLIADADINALPAHWDANSKRIPNNCNQHAVQFIIDTVRQNPDTVIAAIAPLTNIACAVRIAPDVMENANIWAMCGMFSEPYPEWNILCDPEAAAIVLGSCHNVHMIGLDVTLRCRLTPDHVDAIRSTTEPTVSLLSEWTDQWMSKSKHMPILHDPLVIAAIEQPDFMKFEPKQMMVERAGTLTRGVTVERTNPFWRTPQLCNAMVASDVDVETFMKMFLSNVFSGITTNK